MYNQIPSDSNLTCKFDWSTGPAWMLLRGKADVGGHYCEVIHTRRRPELYGRRVRNDDPALNKRDADGEVNRILRTRLQRRGDLNEKD
jgi:hypothetical protein